MKKMLLLSLCIILMLSTAGCSVSGRPAPAVTPDSPVYVGMPTKEFWTLYDNEDVLSMAGFPGVDEDYYFIEDANGNPVVLTLRNIDRKYTITAISAYDKNKIELSTRSFFAIREGMTMQELISILGHPFGSVFSSGDRLTWKVDDTFFDVNFRTQPGDPSILVVNDVLIRDENYTSIINHWYIPFID
jgi:hypothetical protein